MAEEAIAEKARSVAKEVKRYLADHPEFRKNPPFPKEGYDNYPQFKDLIIQKVGKTGYTCLVARPTESEPIRRLWVHPLQQLIGVGIDEAMEKSLGAEYQRWYDITLDAYRTKQGQEAAGYYKWYDKREKYMAMVPVEGTDFFIASTTYRDDCFSRNSCTHRPHCRYLWLPVIRKTEIFVRCG